MIHDLNDPCCKARVLPHLYELSEAIAAGADLDGIMEAAVRAIEAYMSGTAKVLLSIIERKTGEAVLERARGLGEEGLERGVYRPGEGITGQVAATGKAIVVPSVRADPRFLNRAGLLGPGEDAAFICVPVRMGREVMGTLAVDRPPEAGQELERDREVLSIIAAMMAEAVQLQRARLEEQSALREENRRLRDELAERYKPGNIIGNSKQMLALFALLKKVYDKDTAVLILGESGTGKELVAQALHYHGKRAPGPFVRFNCASIPESLAESELFGHEKGAFTGALAQRKGRFEEAHGGSIFLDEIGELSLAVQAKLLRVLQEKEFQRVGGNATIKVDVRVIAATHRDLQAMVRDGTFREDLYYRLNVFPLVLPPLRDRGGDVILLADHFAERFSRAHGTPIRRISTPAIDALCSYHWPGNVRELENVIERAVILSEDGVIHSFHLPPSLQTAKGSNTRYLGSLEEKLERVERESIVEAIKDSGGNMAMAARELGITERVIALRAQRFGIDWRLYRNKRQ
jgi:Nif-specific regulatory protein